MSTVPKERLTVTVAGIKMTLLTSDTKAVRRMASSIDASVQRKAKRVGGRTDIALLMTVMEQAESLKKNACLIRSQQEQIFSLTQKNGALLGEAAESAPIEFTENALMLENARLMRKNEELADEITELKELLKQS